MSNCDSTGFWNTQTTFIYRPVQDLIYLMKLIAFHDITGLHPVWQTPLNPLGPQSPFMTAFDGAAEISSVVWRRRHLCTFLITSPRRHTPRLWRPLFRRCFCSQELLSHGLGVLKRGWRWLSQTTAGGFFHTPELWPPLESVCLRRWI